MAIGAKQEANRHDPGEVVSVESFTAYEMLAELARTVGLDADYEVVPPPGHVHLNRSNLIVLTNPRLLPSLAQVMEADPHLQYVLDDQVWYIHDATSGTDYRSPRDRGETADYGYLGRLPRPDGKGTFLYLAGTHAQGTLGAAHFVANNLVELYKEFRTRRFSTVIKCVYDPTYESAGCRPGCSNFLYVLKAARNGPHAPPPGRAPAAAAAAGARRPSRPMPGDWRGEREARRAAEQRQTVDRWGW